MVNRHLPFGFDRPEDSPGFLLWQTTIMWQRQIKRALESHHISHAEFVIIATLMWLEAHKYEVNQVLIIDISKLDKMTVSKSLKNLAIRGYVNRVEHARDARAKTVSLTENGKNMVRLLVPIVEQIDSQFFGILLSQEQKDFTTLLAKLTTLPVDR